MATYSATVRVAGAPGVVSVRVEAGSVEEAVAASRAAAAGMLAGVRGVRGTGEEGLEVVGVTLSEEGEVSAVRQAGAGGSGRMREESAFARWPVRTIAAGVFLGMAVWTLFALAAALFYRYMTTPAPVVDPTWV